jgi:hypothetical protein
LLLQRIVAWSRSQPGSSKLRAVLLLDEAFGFLPPHPANPASKAPLLTLMKQARAVGLGVVLATQNPVDLDYKALTNAGTWLIGRLSTQNDVRRVAEGLRMAGGGDASDQIGGLAPRQFLMREVGSGSPQRIQSRWAMSYLRGPITSAELRRLPGLTVPTPVIPSAAPSPSPVAADPVSAVAVAAPVAAVAVVAPPPALPRGTEARWLDEHAVFAARMGGTFDAYREAARPDGAVRYSPALLGLMRIRFDEEKDGFLSDETHARLVFPLEGSLTSVGAPVRSEDLSLEAPVRGTHDDLPSVLDESTELTAARTRMVEEVYRRETRGQWVCAAYKLRGKAGESREDFESRCRAAAEEKVDTDLEKLAKRTETKVERLRKKVRKTEAKIEDYEGRLKSERTSELVNGMEILSSFFFGRSRSLSTVASRRKATSAAGRRLEDAGEDLVALQEEIDELTEELEEQSETLREDALAKAAEIEEREVRLEKNDIELLFFGILWVPVSSRV